MTKTGPLPVFRLQRVQRRFEGGGGVFIEDLDIWTGRIVAILGLSGTGKSTLLGMLGGIVPIDDIPGSRLEVRLSHGRSYNLAGADRDTRFDEFGFVFQSSHLLRNATGIMNIAVALRAARRDESLDALLLRAQAVALRPELLVKRARQLSGGEKQRTAIGRGIARDPEVLLADEPTANLDPQNGIRIMGEICRWQRDWQRESRAPRTVVWVTHNILEASIFADDIILLEPGARATTAAPAGIGRLMRPPPEWGLPSTQSINWPQYNPRDPGMLAGMLLGSRELPPHSPATSEIMEAVRRRFVDHAGIAQPGDEVLIARALHRSATALAATVASTGHDAAGAHRGQTAFDLPPPQKPPSPPSRGQAASLGRHSISGIGWAELFSRSAADTSPPPQLFERLIGLPRQLIERARGGPRPEPSRHWQLATRLGLALAVPGLAAIALAGPLEHGKALALQAFGALLVLLGLAPVSISIIRHLAWAARAFSGYFRAVVFIAILLFVAALVLARDAVEASFDASLRSVELGHLVVSYRRGNARLDDEVIGEHDARLRSHIRPALESLDWSLRGKLVYEPVAGAAAATAAYWRSVRASLSGTADGPGATAGDAAPAARREPGLVFGRWLRQDTGVSWPAKAELEEPGDFDPRKICPPGHPELARFDATQALVVSPAEPVIGKMRYLAGSHLGALLPQRAPTDMRWAADSDNTAGVVVSRDLLYHLARRMNAGAEMAIGKYLCVMGPDWRLARIIGIVEALPKEELVPALHLLVPRLLFEEIVRANPNNSDGRVPPFNTEAIYFADPRLTAEYKTYLDEVAKEGTVRPDAFSQIQKGLETSKALTDAVGHILFGVMLFAALLVGMLSFSFIRENEKSLCVLRAFGVRLRHVVGLVARQMLVVWVVALLPTVFLLAWLAPYARGRLIDSMGLAETALHGSLFNWLEQTVVLTVVVLSAAVTATCIWWWRTAAVGDRLKELD